MLRQCGVLYASSSGEPASSRGILLAAGELLKPNMRNVGISSTMQTAKREMQVSDFIEKPIFRIGSLPFIPPPRWANEVPGRLRKAFPNVVPDRRILYLQALIHPSYTTEASSQGTMSSLSPIGSALLQHLAVSFTSQHLMLTGASPAEIRSATSALLGQDALSAVLKGAWGLDDLILTDAIVREFREANSTKGLIRLAQQHGSVLPVSYHQQCVHSMVGAVYLDQGLVTAQTFVKENVFFPALEYLTLEG